LDSTTINLCLSLFPWAKFRKRKAAVKLYQTLQILTVDLFEKTPIAQALQPPDMEVNLLGNQNRLILFDL